MGSNYGACRREVNFLMNRLLTAYWIEFETVGMGSQFGVTAFSLDVAKFLIKEQFFKGLLSETVIPQIRKVTENIQFKDLDQNHVVPNMGPISERGVWYPNLYG